MGRVAACWSSNPGDRPSPFGGTSDLCEHDVGRLRDHAASSIARVDWLELTEAALCTALRRPDAMMSVRSEP